MKSSNAFHSTGNNIAHRIVIALLAMAGALLAACSPPADHNRAAVVLIDISKDYASEMARAQTLSNYLLANLDGGDSLAVAFIDNSSVSERNIIARATFDHRPSVAGQQKRAFQAEVHDFMQRFKVPSHHSDITGGVLLATDYLNDVEAGRKYLFLLSDLQEDLPPWLNREMAIRLEGVQVYAVNVKRQRADNNDPQAYQDRLAGWQRRVEDGGGQWQMVSDLARIENTVALR